MKPSLTELPHLALSKRSENRNFFKFLKRKTPKDLDRIMINLHDNEFNKTNCLECANCCKTTGPLFTNADIERLSKYFKLKPKVFIDKYLIIDEDDDYVLKSLPCNFLDSNNLCTIYHVRPKACKEFPHTNRTKFHQISNLTLLNISICPAAYNIVESLKAKLSANYQQ